MFEKKREKDQDRAERKTIKSKNTMKTCCRSVQYVKGS